jgi:predicted SAM-dependent methyltransferase
VKIIVGAGNTSQVGWLALQHNDLDITDARHWARRFVPGTLDAILAEHVFEHLTPDEAWRAANHCYHYLKRGGYLRIAVPDGFHPDRNYLSWVAPNSPGEQWLQRFRSPKDKGHQVLYTYKTLSRLLENIGFEVRLLEWHDERGVLNKRPWRSEDGDVWRNSTSVWSGLLSLVVLAPYTSLIVDAVKR